MVGSEGASQAKAIQRNSSIKINMRLVPTFALLLYMGVSGFTFAESGDFCRSNCFSEKTACRKNAEQVRSDVGGGPAIAASLLLALSAKDQKPAEIVAGNNADWPASSPMQRRREEFSDQRNEGYLACDTDFSQCVDSCRH